MALTEGGETRYCRAQDPDDPDWSFFDHLMWIPKDAASALARSGTADGDLSMEEAAALLAEQWAEMYRTLPGWVEYRPADMQVSVTDIFDAFYGEPSQFCCDMSFVISVGYDPRQRGYWEAGAGLSDPIAEGEFAGYYHWGMQTLVAKNGDGNWYIADAGSGGYSVYLPGYSLSGGAENDLGNAPLRDLVDFYFQTAGFTHDYLLPYLISEKSPEELQDLNALLDQRTREEAKALVQNIAQVIQKCGWGDMVTLEELHDALDAKYQTYLD